MLSSNIDINDEALRTSVPFNSKELVTLDNIVFNYTWFLSIQLKCTVDAKLPVYMSLFELTEDYVYIIFCSASRDIVGVGRLPLEAEEDESVDAKDYPGVLLFATREMVNPVGHIVYRPGLARNLADSINKQRLSAIDMKTQLELLPECIGIRYPLHTVDVAVDGNKSDTASIKFVDRLQLSKDDEDGYSVNIYADDYVQVPPVKSGIVNVECQTIGASPGRQFTESRATGIKHLYIESELDSDVRVVTSGDTIKIIGAADVQ